MKLHSLLKNSIAKPLSYALIFGACMQNHVHAANDHESTSHQNKIRKEFRYQNAAKLYQTKKLNLLQYGNAITDQDLTFIGIYCPKLTHLWIKSEKMTDEGMREIAKGCQNLKYLFLENASNVTSIGWTYIAFYCKQFQFNLTTQFHNPFSLKCLHSNQSFFNKDSNAIKILDLKQFGDEINNQTLKSISMQFPLLEQISIRSIHVTDRGMNFLARHSKTIKILDISGCPNITMNGIREVILECNMQWLAVNREQCSDDDRFELKSINPELCIITTEAPLAAPANSANIKGPLSY